MIFFDITDSDRNRILPIISMYLSSPNSCDRLFFSSKSAPNWLSYWPQHGVPASLCANFSYWQVTCHFRQPVFCGIARTYIAWPLEIYPLVHPSSIPMFDKRLKQKKNKPELDNNLLSSNILPKKDNNLTNTFIYTGFGSLKSIWKEVLKGR